MEGLGVHNLEQRKSLHGLQGMAGNGGDSNGLQVEVLEM